MTADQVARAPGSGFVARALRHPSFVAGGLLSLLLITPIVSFYLLRDWDRGLAKINRLMPLAYAPTIRSLAREINRTLADYLRGFISERMIIRPKSP